MLNRLTLVQKLIIAFGAVVTVFIAQNLLTRLQMTTVDEAATQSLHTADVMADADALLLALVDIESGERGFALTGDERFLQPYEEGVRAYGRRMSRLRDLVADNPEQVRRLDELDRQYQGFLTEGVHPIIELRRQVDAAAGAVAEPDLTRVSDLANEGTSRAYMADMRALMDEFIAVEDRLRLERDEAMTASLGSMGLLLLLGPAMASVLAVLIVLWLARDMQGRFRTLLDVAHAIGDGDFSQHIDASGNDEVAGVMTEFDRMRKTLAATLATIRGGSERLVGAGGKLGDTVQYLGRSSDEQNEFSSRMAATTEELTVSISEVTRSAEEARDISSSSESMSREGSEIILGSVSSMQAISERVQHAAGRINQLSRQSDEISSIISVIDSVSEQTNLLALNAAIEAARAGEHGRGFAVVADEVRGLAQRAAESTQEISRMINEVQSGIQSAVTEMESTVEQVGRGVEEANRAGDAIREIEAGSHRVLDVVDHISNALRQQSEASDDVARSVEKIASLSSEGASQVHEVRRVLDEVRALSDELEAEIGKFVLNG
ncbi:MAG: methyl-accepting chemotaxis protein [Pseudomonadota bacterium]